MAKTCQDDSLLVIGAQLEAEKKVNEPKDNDITLVSLPDSRPIPFASIVLLLPSIPHV